jgi:DNA invertase Pin-like site-specific DNA recombinase
MKHEVKEPRESLIPAAQYVRMSDDAQQYSIDNQKEALQEYAANHGFVIVQTYADAGKSGVIARNRRGLRELLKDVISGGAKYRAILVYDVSRWGRFPNNDEAAHYEFLCSNSGIPLHYCAEQFTNDGTAHSALLKALKRSMAAEFSRELGEKVFRGKTRLVQLGFWVGGQAGYGYRRLMISAAGKPKQLMKFGERKSLTTDRVTLVLGNKGEVECVKYIFSRAVERIGCMAIARDLNEKGVLLNRRLWTHTDVSNIVKNPKYAGCNVWHRGTQRLRDTRRPVEPHDWITKPGAFPAIVDQQTFDLAQRNLPRRSDSFWSDHEIKKKLRRLLAAKGRLSESLILKSRGMPSSNTLKDHFGSIRKAYEAIGYSLSKEDIHNNDQGERSLRLRRTLVSKIQEMFPENVVVTHLPNKTRSILRIDQAFMVSILLCRPRKSKTRTLHWEVVPNAERENITLLCKMNSRHDRICGFYLFPNMDDIRSAHRSPTNDPWLRKGIKLASISEFYEAVTRVRSRV